MASSKSSATIEVLINGVISNEARVHDIRQVSGASVNTAVFEVVAPSTNIMETENNNLAGIAGQNQRVEIKIYDQNAQPHTVFLGRVTGATISIGPQGEVIKYTARLDPNMFGPSITHAACMNLNDKSLDNWERASFGLAYTEESIVFNPVINGVPTPNKTAWDVTDNASVFFQEKVFIDPRQVSPWGVTAAIDDRQNETQVVTNPYNSPSRGTDAICDYWSLREAVEFVLLSINSGEVYINNPSQAVINILPEDGTQIRNLHIRRGMYLPEALDALLLPFGYYWYVDFDNPFGPTIAIEQRGLSGTETIKRQAPGVQVDLANTDLWKLDINYDISNKTISSNTAYGECIIKEGTFELIPAFDLSAVENGDFRDMWKDTQGTASASGGAGQFSMMKWVLNEAGDYNHQWGLAGQQWYVQNEFVFSHERTETIAAFDWDAFFGADAPNQTNHIKRRSRFLPMVQMDQQGTGPAGPVNGTFIEFGKWDPVDLKWIWTPIGGVADKDSATVIGDCYSSYGIQCGVRLLEEEAGIIFSDPPAELIAALRSGNPDYANWPRIRITASLACDERLQDSLLAVKSLPLDPYDAASDVRQFRKRAVEKTGDYKSVLWPANVANIGFNGLVDGSTDDTNAIQNYNSQIVNTYSQATVTGSAVLNALDFVSTDWIGKSITKVEGLELGLETSAALGFGATYPIVTGVTYDVNNQVTILSLGTT